MLRNYLQTKAIYPKNGFYPISIYHRVKLISDKVITVWEINLFFLLVIDFFPIILRKVFYIRRMRWNNNEFEACLPLMTFLDYPSFHGIDGRKKKMNKMRRIRVFN